MRPANDFHDGVLLSVSFDIAKREVHVKVLAYETDDAKTRTPFLIKFEHVVSSSFVSDMDELANNALSGHIVSLHLPEIDGTTRMNLSGGTLVIVSRSFQLENDFATDEL